MAKPITPTPVLRGKDALVFMRSIVSEQNKPSARRLRFIRQALRQYKCFDIRT
ncbi:MAG: hypothetical protein WCY41_02115 [Candidatus Micrarchaeia archaeon]